MTTSSGRKILLLRSGASDARETHAAGPEGDSAPDVLVLFTHAIETRQEGIREALVYDARGARLVVSSRVTVKIFLESEQAPSLFGRPFAELLAVGEGTAGDLRRATERAAVRSGGAGARNSAPIRTPDLPGAAGVVHLLRRNPLHGVRILWPRGSDAADEPLEQLRTLGAIVTAPVVYEKRPRTLEQGDPALTSLLGGEVGAVAVGSLAALDVLLGAVWACGRPLPPVRWGVLGPETARAFAARGLPAPLVPRRPRLPDLIDLLRENLP